MLGTAQVGGTERQLLLLLDHLDRTRFRSTVILLRGGPLVPDFEARAETTVLGKASRADPRFLRRLVSALRRLGPNIAHAMGPTPNLWVPPAARIAGCRATIVSVTDAGPPAGGVRGRFETLGIRHADRIVGNSQAAARTAGRRGAKPEKVRIIRSGVPLAEPPPFGSRTSAVVVVGRLDPVKGQDVAIAALAAVLPQFPNATMVIAGAAVLDAERGYKESLQTQISGLGLNDKVELAGHQPSSRDVLARAAIAVVPSRAEAFPNVVLEAMALATPIVASAVGGIPELVEDGVTGWLVPPNDPPALATAIVAALRDREEAARRATAARERVLQLTPGATASRWMDLYEELLCEADQAR